MSAAPANVIQGFTEFRELSRQLPRYRCRRNLRSGGEGKLKQLSRQLQAEGAAQCLLELTQN
jgi:hypothetical protein